MESELSPGRKLLLATVDMPDIALKVPADDDLVLAGINSGDINRLGLAIEQRTDRALTDDDLVELQTVSGIDRVLSARSRG